MGTNSKKAAQKVRKLIQTWQEKQTEELKNVREEYHETVICKEVEDAFSLFEFNFDNFRLALPHVSVEKAQIISEKLAAELRKIDKLIIKLRNESETKYVNNLLKMDK